MEGEIDIEEHDLMENPAIKNIFPDISVLKKEIHCYGEEVITMKQINQPSEIYSQNSHSELIPQSSENTILRQSNTNVLQDSKKYLPTCNTVNSRNVDQSNAVPLKGLKQEQSKKSLHNTAVYLPNNSVPQDSLKYLLSCKVVANRLMTIQTKEMQGNKIILGSKPNKDIDYEGFFKKQVTSYDLKVIIEDLKPYLEKSNRYCRDCLILFPTTSHFENHQRTHFQLVRPKKSVSKLQKRCSQRKLGMKKNFVNVASMISKARSTCNDPSQVDGNKKCFHCKKVFSNAHSLMKHLYSTLKFKNNLIQKPDAKTKYKNQGSNDDKELITFERNISEKDKIVYLRKVAKSVQTKDTKINTQLQTQEKNNYELYRCYICSYYFTVPGSYRNHLTHKHDVKKILVAFKKVVFEPRCKFCFYHSSNVHSYNDHIHQRHKHKMSEKNVAGKIPTLNNTTNLKLSNQLSTGCATFVLKSSLFKCNKCDVHFLSTETAKNHREHMEILINWKCCICQRIFKENDSVLHEKQHSFSDIFTVYELSQSDARVLYSCLKCGVHFNEDIFINHYPICGLETVQTVYCKVCEILIDRSISGSHETSHLNGDLESMKTMTVVCDIPYMEFLEDSSSPKNTIQHKRKSDTNFNITPPKKKSKFEYYIWNLFYCRTCKCCVSKLNPILHINSICKKFQTFMCKICGLGFTQISYKKHMTLHDEMQNLKLQDFCFTDIRTGKEICPPLPEFSKCNNCEVEFATKEALYRHECMDGNYLTCHVCEAKLSEECFKLHISFHNYSIINKRNGKSGYYGSDKLLNSKGDPTPENTLDTATSLPEYLETDSSQMLFSCSNCFITVNTYDKVLEHCKYHYNNEEKHWNTLKCNICNLNFECTSYDDHQKCHLDEGRPNFFRIFKFDTTYFRSESDVWLKHDTNFCISDSKKKSSTIILDYVFNLFYCTTCKSFVSKQRPKRHLKSKCKNFEKQMCKICGLVFTLKTYKTHTMMHDKRQNVKLQDFSFTDIRTGKEICPPVPEFMKCSFCEVNFASKLALYRHECMHENYLTCHICKVKLMEDAFKLHMPYHNYSIKNTKTVESSEEEQGTIENTLDAATSPPEYLETDPSRVLFSCTNCFIVVNNYDKVVEHCQDHYNNEENRWNTLKCNICNLNFESTSYEGHQKCHLDEGGTDFFRIFKFDTTYFTSESDVWLKHLFGSLPPKDIMEVIGNSIYQYEHRIKMEVIQDGQEYFTVYKCHKCCCIIDCNSIFRHADNACFKLRKHPCSYCGLPFISSFSRIQHEPVHSRLNIGLKSYRIVIFNRQGDEPLNNRLKSINMHVLYLCRNCNVTIEKSEIRVHKCSRIDLKKCLNCGLLFKNVEYASHILKHKELTKFTESNMKVIIFGEKSENNEVKAFEDLVSSFKGIICDYTIFRCEQCQICETTEKCKSKHVCSFGSSRYKCDSCDLYFNTTNFKYHLKLHESDPDFLRNHMRVLAFDLPFTNGDCDDNESESNHGQTSPIGNLFDYPVPQREDPDKIINLEDNIQYDGKNYIAMEKHVKIYKCTCGLNFLDELSISTHFKSCTPRIRASKQKCSKCDLLFTPNILFSHLLMHHGNKKLICKFHIVEISNMLIPEIFKCSKCELHFVKHDAVSNHFKCCTGQPNDSVLCADCNIMFNCSCMSAHQDYYHKVGLKKYKVVVIDEELHEKSLNEKTPEVHAVDVINKDNTNQSQSKNALKHINYSTIYKCKECSIHYLTKKQIKLHLGGKHQVLLELQDICNICGLNFVSSVLAKHIYFHHEKLNLRPDELNIKEYTDDDF